MGSSPSKPQAPPKQPERSTGGTVQTNLLWCLSETTSWEDRAADVDLILKSKTFQSLGQQQNGFDRRQAVNVLQLVDQLVRTGGHEQWLRSITDASRKAAAEAAASAAEAAGNKKKKSKGKSNETSQEAPQISPQQALRRPSLGGGVLGIDPREVIARGLPEFLQPLPVSASKLFAAAAAEVVSNAPVYDDEENGGDSIGPAQGGSSIDQLGDESVAPSQPAGVGQVPLSDQTALTDILAPFNGEVERKELVAKYLFIHAMLEKLGRSAAFSYKLFAKIQTYQRQLQVLSSSPTQSPRSSQGSGAASSTGSPASSSASGTSRASPSSSRASPATSTPSTPNRVQTVQQATIDRNRRHCETQLFNAIANFEKARMTMYWLYRDFDLTLVNYRLREQLSNLKSSRDRMRHLAEQPSSVQQLDATVQQLEQAKILLELERQANEREALNIGLSYLDRNNSGALEVEEVPELSALLYKVLDGRNTGGVNRADLQMAITRRLDRVQYFTSQMKRAQDEIVQRQASADRSEADQVRIMDVETQMSALQSKLEQERMLLRAIYAYFHTSFAKHVLGKLEVDFSTADLDEQTLAADLKGVMMAAWLDPLTFGSSPEADREAEARLAAEAELRLRERVLPVIAAPSVLAQMLSTITLTAAQHTAMSSNRSIATSRMTSATSKAQVAAPAVASTAQQTDVVQQETPVEPEPVVPHEVGEPEAVEAEEAPTVVEAAPVSESSATPATTPLAAEQPESSNTGGLTAQAANGLPTSASDIPSEDLHDAGVETTTEPQAITFAEPPTSHGGSKVTSEPEEQQYGLGRNYNYSALGASALGAKQSFGPTETELKQAADTQSRQAVPVTDLP